MMMESKGKEILIGNHAKKKEAGQQLGKHLDTYWTKGMEKNKQERERHEQL